MTKKFDKTQKAALVGAAQSRLDRVITWVSPAWGSARLKNRLEIGAWSRSRPGRLTSPRRQRIYRHGWQPGPTSADSAISGDLDEYHALINDLLLDSPIANAIRKTQVTHTIGSGLDLRPVVDREALSLDDEAAMAWERRTRRLWRSWSDSIAADLRMQLKFWQMQRQAFASWREKGDAFVFLAARDEPINGFRLALQAIEAERISNPGVRQDGEMKEDSSRVLSSGVEYRNGVLDAYHVSRYHPGEYAGANMQQEENWTRVEAFRRSGPFIRPNVLVLADPMRIGQTRGLSDYQVVLESIKNITGYGQAEADAAFRAAMYMGFVTSEYLGEEGSSGEDRKDLAKNPYSWDEEKASLYDLAEGEDIKFPGPGRPNEAFGPFVDFFSMIVGAATGTPKEIFMAHFQTSYTAAQAAMNVFWAYVRENRDLTSRNLCQGVYQAWLDEAVNTGRVIAPGYWSSPVAQAAWSGSRWVGPPKMVIREDIAVESAAKRIETRLSSRRDEIMQHSGRDYEAVQAELDDENESSQDPGMASPAG